MHTFNGSTVSASADSSTSLGPQRHQRSSSRNKSVSSASVVTIKRTGSLSSSGTGALKGQTPTELIALRLSRETERRKSVAVDSTERASGEGLGGFSRHSHSTNSSINSTSNFNTRRSRASSGAMFPPQTSANFSPKRNWPPVDHSPRASPQRRKLLSRPGSRRGLSPTSSPERERQRPSRPDIINSLTALPPLQPTPALTDPNDTESPSTIPTVATPLSSYGQDYFGDDSLSPRSNVKSKRSSTTRSHIATISGGSPGRAVASEMAQEALPENRQQFNDATTLKGSTAAEQQDMTSTQPPPEDERRHRRTRTHERGERDKKQMLSRALQKANTAVLLDNAQNFEGALEAYGDACRLLQQVMDRSSGIEDRRKLDSIRETYTNRMEELHQLEFAQPGAVEEKSLPTRPMSDESLPLSPISPVSQTIDSSLKGLTAVETPTALEEDVPKLSYPQNEYDSFLSDTMQAVEDSSKKDFDEQTPSAQPESLVQEHSTSAGQFDFGDAVTKLDLEPDEDDEDEEAIVEDAEVVGLPPLRTHAIHLPLPEDSKYMPAPLSPRRPSSPKLTSQAEQAWLEEPNKLNERDLEPSPELDHDDAPVSWLNTIEESNSSRASSVHSVSSEQGVRRKHLRGASDGTNADLDAAFDAAVEAAYDQGFEPDLESRHKHDESPVISHAQKDSFAVRASLINEISPPSHQFEPNSSFPLAPEDEEEERLLDYITQDYAQGFNFDLSTKSALPRQSDSSGYSRSTWQSSQVSDRTTAGTSLSTVAEDVQPTPASKNAFVASTSLNTVLAEQPPPPLAPPPQSALPKLPNTNSNRTVGVRNRRLSGQNPKQLKIQTSSESELRSKASTIHHSEGSHEDDHEKRSALDKDFKFGTKLESNASVKQQDALLRSPPSLDLRSAVSDSSRPMTATTVTTDQRTSLDDEPTELIIHRPPIPKNKSSASLREHMILLGSPTVEHGHSIPTPMSSTFMTYAAKQRSTETPSTTQRANLPTLGTIASDSLHSGGIYLFDTSLSNSQHPTSPRSPAPHQPSGLEPCPESFLLRPFWLMRTIASTLTHQKGGFLTTRLFVPREVWLTRGVKLKSVEDKIANCDLLTAALGKLAGVDTYDADAMGDELQNFEEVMERVQTALVKRLGSDVGISGLAGVFKDAATGSTSSGTGVNGGDTITGAEKTRSKESKGYLNSWRKLRSKSSGAPTTLSQTSKAAIKAAEKELPTMDSVPITSYVPVERRGQKKDVRNLVFEGPNREYMGSLARLFESVQILDQIARQVVDPGLKGTSPTHVGLELSIRHAAEFFCFYVCRFVLADLGTLLDKFVKRGTEWVLA